jgi:hypothetical protein
VSGKFISSVIKSNDTQIGKLRGEMREDEDGSRKTPHGELLVINYLHSFARWVFFHL